MQSTRRGLAFILAIYMFAAPVCSMARERESVMLAAADYLAALTKNPHTAVTGGEWLVIGLARSGAPCGEHASNYYQNLCSHLRERGGILSASKYTEYSRAALALTAIGADASNVAGFDLTKPLGDIEKVAAQGCNGPIFALLALDCGNYFAAEGVREELVARILSCQSEEGGFCAAPGTKADVDITAMALCALAEYTQDAAVRAAQERALEFLSNNQLAGGGFEGAYGESAESCAQVLIALAALGISAQDERFVKDSYTPIDALLACYVPGEGFSRIAGGQTDPMTSEQALCALAAYKRFENGESAFYDMKDAVVIYGGESTFGLNNRSERINFVPLLYPGKSFEDIQTIAARESIEALAARGIISGRSAGVFDGEGGITRAEFAVIMTRALGIATENECAFSDVHPNSWYSNSVAAAHSAGLITGVTEKLFCPNDMVTRAQGAVILARAASLCGLETDFTDSAVRDVLSQFEDYTTVESWARKALAFCFESGIMEQSAMEIGADLPLERCQSAQMVYELMRLARLL
ncbi:MAG: S-layer homology domain-containing protein [Clostridia bacterium]|nr:S-layer homology domain-containing protein [Clostridia bacterium]